MWLRKLVLWILGGFFWKPFGVVELQHFSDLHALDDIRLSQGQVELQLKTHHEQTR